MSQGHMADLPRNRFPQHAALLRPQPHRQPVMSRERPQLLIFSTWHASFYSVATGTGRLSHSWRRWHVVRSRQSVGRLHRDRGCRCAAEDQGRRHAARGRMSFTFNAFVMDSILNVIGMALIERACPDKDYLPLHVSQQWQLSCHVILYSTEPACSGACTASASVVTPEAWAAAPSGM